MFDPHDALFWVLLSFIGFMALLAYYGVPRLIGKALDDRAEGIRKELDEARRLRGGPLPVAGGQHRRADADARRQAVVLAAHRLARAARRRRRPRERRPPARRSHATGHECSLAHLSPRLCANNQTLCVLSANACRDNVKSR